MRLSFSFFAASVLALSTGCSVFDGGFSLGSAFDSGADLYKAVSLSDAEVQSMASQVAQQSDRENKIDPAGGKYAARLTKVTSRVQNYDGLKLNFKAYKVQEVNAFALANGSIRVYSGLMDMMTDDELLCIIGHEIGHVKEGHSKEKMRLAYAASAARKGVAATSTIAGTIASSEIGGFTEEVVNAQFSQSEETESDEYGLAMMKKLGKNPAACPSGLRKLASLGGSPSLLSSHPDPEDRAQNLEKIILASK